MPSAALRRPGSLITPAEYRGLTGQAPTTRTALPDMRALGRLPTGEMNKTEARYDAHLWARRASGEVVWHKFEALKFRLADNTFYTPDFAVMLAGGALEAHETKGFWTDDARVKIKVAAALYPIQFIAIRLVKGAWVEERF
jgi:hypothetical protein